MAGYQINISNSEGEIEFSSEKEDNAVTIKTVDFRINTINDNTRNRSDAIRAELEIRGEINKSNRESTLKLLKWSIDNNQKTLYRKVEVVVYDSENLTGEVLRRYEIANMFVIDYDETTCSESDEMLNFRLFIAQKEGDRDIKIFSN